MAVMTFLPCFTLLKENVEALMIPEQALVPERSTQSVFVVTAADNIVEQRQVKTGRRRPGEVEIVEGLEAEEQGIGRGSGTGRWAAGPDELKYQARRIRLSSGRAGIQAFEVKK